MELALFNFAVTNVDLVLAATPVPCGRGDLNGALKNVSEKGKLTFFQGSENTRLQKTLGT